MVLSAPSGAGKTAIAEALLVTEPGLRRSISVTTRPARPGEVDGVHYYFRGQAEFDRMVAAGELLEWAHVLGRHSYGTPRTLVEETLQDGKDMVFDIDWQGHRKLRAALPNDVVSVFILPPTLGTLERRLRHRSGEDAGEIMRRMKFARAEISHWHEFDYVVLNDELDHAIAAVRSVLHSSRLATGRLIGFKDFVDRL